MAEVKRAKLIPFDCERASDNSTKEVSKTVRISVVLAESTEDNFPEYNYQDELAAVKKMRLKNPIMHTNGLDPFNEDDDDVKRIAAQMEEKYGMGVAKKQKWRKDEFADIGMGYDESDSFIDNTDGYDEIVPKNVSAVHGGFYINCGALEFKTDEGVSSDISSSSEDETQKKSPRKRILESSAASEDEASNVEKSDVPEKKPKIMVGPNGMQKAIKKRLFGHDKVKHMRKKRNSESKRTVRDLLKERRVDLDMTTSEFVDTFEHKDIILTSIENKKSADSVDNVIESVINALAKSKEEDEVIIIKDGSSSKDSNHPSVNQTPEVDSCDEAVQSPEYVQLPENLPSDIVEIIDNMKKAAAASTEGKVKFFAGHVNIMLLNLERKCRCLGKQSRNKVYEHLAPYVKCRKETLIKRTKNLVVLEEKKKIKSLIDKLKEAVSLTMPDIIKKYEEECKAVLQKKFSAQDEANKNLRMPKRHFDWDDNTKKLVRDIIAVRKKCFLNEDKQKDSLEQHLITFLKSDLQGIWPEGWMSINTLMKYSNLTKDRTIIEPSKKNTSNALLDADDCHSIPSKILVNSSSGLTITPVATNVHKNNSVENKSQGVTPSETISTRINSDSSNAKKSSVVLPLLPTEIVKTFQPEQNNVKYNHSSTNILPVSEELKKTNSVSKEASPIQKDHKSQREVIVKKDEQIIHREVIVRKDQQTTQREVIVKKDEHIRKDEIVSRKDDSATNKIDVAHISVIKQEPSINTVSTIGVIDLTDQPELIRKPGPKSKTKYYEAIAESNKLKKETSKLNEEFSGSSAFNQIITDSLILDQNKIAQKCTNNTGSTNNLNHSVLKNHRYDYSKPKMITTDYNKVKLSSNDSAKTKSSHIKEYTRTKSISEGDDIQRAMESLMVLQKMSSPSKPKLESKPTSAVPVINFNKGYSIELQHLPTSTTPTSNNVPRRNSSFQDVYQKDFIRDFNLMKASQNLPSKTNYNSISTYNNHTNLNSTSSASDHRYLQTTNHLYTEHNSNNKLKSISCSSPRAVGSYNMLDDMYTNFLNEYGHSKTANSKSSTHQN